MAAVVLDEEGNFGVQAFNSLEELVAFLKTLLDRDVHVVPFIGYKLGISKLPFRMLILPDGSLPLFDYAAAALEVEPDGFVGKPRKTLVPPESETIDAPATGTPPPRTPEGGVQLSVHSEADDDSELFGDVVEDPPGG